MQSVWMTFLFDISEYQELAFTKPLLMKILLISRFLDEILSTHILLS